MLRLAVFRLKPVKLLRISTDKDTSPSRIFLKSYERLVPQAMKWTLTSIRQLNSSTMPALEPVLVHLGLIVVSFQNLHQISYPEMRSLNSGRAETTLCIPAATSRLAELLMLPRRWLWTFFAQRLELCDVQMQKIPMILSPFWEYTNPEVRIPESVLSAVPQLASLSALAGDDHLQETFHL
jgi:hypothetical protein